MYNKNRNSELLNMRKNTLRIVTITLFVLILCTTHVHAFDLDMTVEDDIRKNYNSSQLVKDTNTDDLEELPALPQNLKKQNSSFAKQVTQTKQNASVVPQNTPVYTKGNVKISKGSSFNVVSKSNISDW